MFVCAIVALVLLTHNNAQLVRQYPSSFEFTGHYLERVVEGLYSAAFLTFSGVSLHGTVYGVVYGMIW